MKANIMLVALAAFALLLAGCVEEIPVDETPGIPAEEPAPPEEPVEDVPPAEEVPADEVPPVEDEPAPPQEEEMSEIEELAGLFDIELGEPPDDFEYAKAPGEE